MKAMNTHCEMCGEEPATDEEVADLYERIEALDADVIRLAGERDAALARNEALDAKCALLAASLKKSDAAAAETPRQLAGERYASFLRQCNDCGEGWLGVHECKAAATGGPRE